MSCFLKIIHPAILNTCYSLWAQHEDDSDMQWNTVVDYSQDHQLRLIAHQGILLLHQFKPFLHQLRVVLFAHSWRKQRVKKWGTFQTPSVPHRDSTWTNTQTMQWQPSRDVSHYGMMGQGEEGVGPEQERRPRVKSDQSIHRRWRGGKISDFQSTFESNETTDYISGAFFSSQGGAKFLYFFYRVVTDCFHFMLLSKDQSTHPERKIYWM